MYLYLPVALTSIHAMLPVGLGLAVGLLSGLFGVGGGFLLTPLLIMFGIPSTVAAASGAASYVAASTSGTYAHWKAGNVDIKMGLAMLAGGFLGGLGGVQAIKALKVTGNADFVIKLTYVVMLGLVGGFMLYEGIRSLKRRNRGAADNAPESETALARFLKSLPMQMQFEKSGVAHSALVPFALGAFVGLLAAVMGVGGGFIMVPIMVYILRMPMHVVVGTSLFQILFNSIEITFLQATTNHSVDLILALLLLVGSALGAQVGAAFGKKLKGEQLRVILASIVLGVAVEMVFDLAMPPALLLAQVGG